NCAKLIEGLPQLVRDDRRVEDIRKMDGDVAADAARYGLVSGAGLAGLNLAGPCSPYGGAGLAPPGLGYVGPGFSPASGGSREDGAFARGAWAAPRFVTGMPLGEQIARQVSAEDATSRAIHYQRLESEARPQFRP